jgi:hypothetical protein
MSGQSMNNEDRMLFGKEFQEELNPVEIFDFKEFKNLGEEQAQLVKRLIKEEKALANNIKKIVQGEQILSINRNGVRIHLNEHEGFTSEHLKKIQELVPMVRFEVHYIGPGNTLGGDLETSEGQKQILTIRW